MLKQKSHQSNKHMDSAPCKILGTIFEIDQEGTQTYWLKDEKIDDDAQI